MPEWELPPDLYGDPVGPDLYGDPVGEDCCSHETGVAWCDGLLIAQSGPGQCRDCFMPWKRGQSVWCQECGETYELRHTAAQ